jgi:plasmid stabilization system protein ParE
VSFRLTRQAIDDLDAICIAEAERSGWERSMDVEARLWKVFESVGRNPGVGHLRRDLDPQDLYFVLSSPYMVVYRQNLPIVAITGIVHGSRDLTTLLASRKF